MPIYTPVRSLGPEDFPSPAAAGLNALAGGIEKWGERRFKSKQAEKEREHETLGRMISAGDPAAMARGRFLSGLPPLDPKDVAFRMSEDGRRQFSSIMDMMKQLNPDAPEYGSQMERLARQAAHIAGVDYDASQLMGAPTPRQEQPEATPSLTPGGEAAVGRFTPGKWMDQSLIDEASKTYNLRPELVSSVIKNESAFDPNAVSSAGATGLMQLMPGTAEEMGVTDPRDPRQNVMGGSKYLRSMMDRYGDEAKGVLAYHQGPGNVDRGTIGPQGRAYQERVMADAGQGGTAPSKYVGTWGGRRTQGRETPEEAVAKHAAIQQYDRSNPDPRLAQASEDAHARATVALQNAPIEQKTKLTQAYNSAIQPIVNELHFHQRERANLERQKKPITAALTSMQSARAMGGEDPSPEEQKYTAQLTGLDDQITDHAREEERLLEDQEIISTAMVEKNMDPGEEYRQLQAERYKTRPDEGGQALPERLIDEELHGQQSRHSRSIGETIFGQGQ